MKWIFFRGKAAFLCQCNSTFDVNEAFFFFGRRLKYDNFRLKLVQEVAGAGKYFTGLNQF
jgi:hypothetical protein